MNSIAYILMGLLFALVPAVAAASDSAVPDVTASCCCALASADTCCPSDGGREPCHGCETSTGESVCGCEETVTGEWASLASPTFTGDSDALLRPLSGSEPAGGDLVPPHRPPIGG